MHSCFCVYRYHVTPCGLAIAGRLSPDEFRPSTPPYDFLAFIDEDYPHKELVNMSDHLAYANEHGIGL